MGNRSANKKRVYPQIVLYPKILRAMERYFCGGLLECYFAIEQELKNEK